MNDELFEMPDAQWRRLERMRLERHFLLEAKTISPNLAKLSVSGSTGNVYEISIDSQTNCITCTCPDFSSGAECESVVCKHCCFVIYRVFKSCLRPSFFEDNEARTFSSEDITIYQRKVAHLQRTLSSSNQPFVSPKLIQHFNNLKSSGDAQNNQVDKETITENENFGLKLAKNCDSKSLEDCCGMCYEEFKDTPGTDYFVCCGECKKMVHQECADIWLKNKADTCIYCRSWLSYSAYLEYKQSERKTKKHCAETYINVLE